MSEFTPAIVKPTITVADVEKLDVRVGTIVSVDDVAKSTKLLKLTVDFGDHTRTILAGMKAETYCKTPNAASYIEKASKRRLGDDLAVEAGRRLRQA